MERNFIEEKIKSLTDGQLKQCWDEINQYNKDGMIGDCLLREIRKELSEIIGDKSWDGGCRVVVIPEILYEIARRHYNNK